MQRFSPRQINGTTSRTLLVVDDPEEVVARAVAAGATESSSVGDEHGWRLGRIIDPFGHEWEVFKPSRSAAADLSPASHGREDEAHVCFASVSGSQCRR
jgi:uncharacterized glyoxalase superfamily protein PhnB